MAGEQRGTLETRNEKWSLSAIQGKPVGNRGVVRRWDVGTCPPWRRRRPDAPVGALDWSEALDAPSIYERADSQSSANASSCSRVQY